MNRIWLVVAAWSATAAVCVAQDEPVEAVLAKVWNASGRANLSAQGVRLSGKATIAGTEAEYSLTFNSAGHYLQEVRGPVTTIDGFDGERAWTEDLGGERLILSLGDRERALLAGAVMTGRWMEADGPMELTLDKAPQTDGSRVLAFRMKGGELAGRVRIDSTTWLPLEWTYQMAGAVHTLQSSGRIMFGGMSFPASIQRGSTEGRNLSVTISGAEAAPTFIRSPYEPALGPPADVLFDDSLSAAVEIKRAPTGHILVHPRIAGKDVGWFIFDTGAGSNVLDRRAVTDLALETFGQVPAIGVGGATMASFCRPESLSLGRATITRPMMVAMDLAFLDQYMGEKIAGLIGYGMLHRTVAEIDMQTPSVALHNPGTFDGAGLSWSKLAVDARVPCVEATFEGRAGWFRLDTGAGSTTVHFHEPAVRKFKLLEGRKTEPSMSGGVGGMVASRTGTLEWFEIGGHRSDEVDVVFATTARGALADPFTVGNLGGGLIKPFKMVTDYQRGRIAWVKRD